MVLTAHAMALGTSRQLLANGDASGAFAEAFSAGIHLFFALSGYLIAGPYIRALIEGRPLQSAKRYAIRRAARIYPAYWVALTAILLLVPHPRVGFGTLAAHYLLLQNALPHQAKTLYFVAWTLGVEAMFYIFVPLAAEGLRRLYRGRAIPVGHMVRFIAGVWVASAVASAVYAALGPSALLESPIHTNLPTLLAQFCPGMLLAVFLTREAETAGGAAKAYRWLAARPGATVGLAAASTIAGLVVRFPLSMALDLYRSLYAIAAGLLLVAVVNGGRATDTAARWIAPFGTISYGIYLWHWVAIRVLLHHHIRPSAGGDVVALAINTLTLAIITIPIAAASWYLVEHPLMKRAARSRRPPPNAPAQAVQTVKA
jgi:peptidoglycan/LPS O-acetylase OafA/YrhL